MAAFFFPFFSKKKKTKTSRPDDFFFLFFAFFRGKTVGWGPCPRGPHERAPAGPGMFEDVSEYVKLRDCLADGTHALHFSQLAAAPPYDPVNEAFLTFPTSIWRSSSGQTDEEARTWKPPKLEGKRATLSEMRQLSARCRSQEPPSSSFLLASADKGVAATTE